MDMVEMLMTLDEVAVCVKAKTPGEAKGWLKRAGVSPVPFGGKLGTRYMRQDVGDCPFEVECDEVKGGAWLPYLEKRVLPDDQGGGA